jgi:hypothetical protein
MYSRTAVALLVIGCLLIASSWILPQVVGGRKAWSEDDAAQLATVQTELHSLREQMGTAFQKQKSGDGDSALTRQTAESLEAAEARYKQLSARLDAAREKGQSTALVLRWIGVAIAAVGAAGFAAARSKQR